ncbi:unnamed protein product [Blepharisma stoltei]|uniref:C2H2-type domain-containing protein n=1 Tax=Blepharisma stoltei TaxID=1481888 RepID=A0AAU9JWI0_9CILI|nr:unnamed protein product [Blepharisma stoltei]
MMRFLTVILILLVFFVMEEKRLLSTGNMISSIKNIQIQEIGGTPFFVIPMFAQPPSMSQAPPKEIGRDYREEYKKLLAENETQTGQLQNLLADIDKLQKDIQGLERQQPSIKHERPQAKAQRTRRPAKQINRHYRCRLCPKSYGSEGSLNQHMKLKHFEFYQQREMSKDMGEI